MNQIKWPTGFNKEDFVGNGNYGAVCLDSSSSTVVKFPHKGCEEAIRIEIKIYERFEQHGGHAGLLRYLGPYESGLRLELASNYGLRRHLQDRGSEIASEQRLRWCQQIACALAFVHSKGVIHGDLHGGNIFLDGDLNAKVGDFAGSSLDGSPLLIAVTASHRYPGRLLSKQADIFALGSTLFEVTCGQTPYDGLPDKEIKDLFEKSKFPETKGRLGPIGDIIAGCWQGKYRSVDKVTKCIEGMSLLFKICSEANHMFSYSISMQSSRKHPLLFQDNNINRCDIGNWVAHTLLDREIITSVVTWQWNIPSVASWAISNCCGTASLHNLSVFPFHWRSVRTRTD